MLFSNKKKLILTCRFLPSVAVVATGKSIPGTEGVLFDKSVASVLFVTVVVALLSSRGMASLLSNREATSLLSVVGWASVLSDVGVVGRAGHVSQ